MAYNVTLILLAGLLCMEKMLQNMLYHLQWAGKVLRMYQFPVNQNVSNYSMQRLDPTSSDVRKRGESPNGDLANT